MKIFKKTLWKTHKMPKNKQFLFVKEITIFFLKKVKKVLAILWECGIIYEHSRKAGESNRSLKTEQETSIQKNQENLETTNVKFVHKESIKWRV